MSDKRLSQRALRELGIAEDQIKAEDAGVTLTQPQPDDDRLRATLHAAQIAMIEDRETRWFTNNLGESERFIPAHVAIREVNKARAALLSTPATPTVQGAVQDGSTVAQPDTALTVERLAALRGYPDAAVGWRLDPIGAYVQWSDVLRALGADAS